MSPAFNYVGIGMALRSSTGKTYGTMVLIDGPRPVSARARRWTSVTRDGNDITWTWTAAGRDPPDPDIAGSPATPSRPGSIRAPGSTIATPTARPAVRRWIELEGITYGVRVAARDRGRQLGAWSSELRIWVP